VGQVFFLYPGPTMFSLFTTNRINLLPLIRQIRLYILFKQYGLYLEFLYICVIHYN